MIDNKTYNAIKLYYKLTSLVWFLDKYAIKEAQGDADCVQKLTQLKTDLEKHLEALHQSLQNCSKEFKCK